MWRVRFLLPVKLFAFLEKVFNLFCDPWLLVFGSGSLVWYEFVNAFLGVCFESFQQLVYVKQQVWYSLVMNFCWGFPMWFQSLSHSAFLYKGIFLLCYWMVLACSEPSVRTALWSDIPSITSQWWLKDLLFVRNKSRMLFPLAGFSTTCSNPASSIMSIKQHWVLGHSSLRSCPPIYIWEVKITCNSDISVLVCCF